MKRMSLIAFIAAMTAIFTGCGNDTIEIDSKKDVAVSTTTSTVFETTSADITVSDSTVTTAAFTTETSSERNKQDDKQTEHSADDSANKGGHEPTYEMEQYAVNDIDALNNVLAMFGGKGIDCDESDTISADIDGETIIYSKVSDSNVLAFSNTEDVKNYMILSLPESEYQNYMTDFERHFRDENGSLYMNTNVGRSFYQFSCNIDDMIFTDITGDAFTVTYKEADQMFGMGYVYFKNESGNWKICGFELK